MEPAMPRIRNYRPDDWDSFLALDLETGLTTLRSAPKTEKDAFLARWADVLKTTSGWTDAGPTVDRGVLFVLEDDDQTYAGHLWLSEEADAFSGATRLWVRTVAIVAKYRSRGWGRLLMERAIEESRMRKLGAVGLAVAADNVVARKLYEEMGFEATSLNMVRRI
jgi:ribosomal protein S18 acetylase RimI-like enzyme